MVEGFAPRSLRQWKAARSGPRLVHRAAPPAGRARTPPSASASCPPAVLPEVRANMIRTFQLPVPPEGVDPADPGWDDGARRPAFARFLQLLRFPASGQTSIRADPAWASQLALVQGLAGAWPPARLLREEGLAEALAGLAARVGRRRRPPGRATPMPPASPPSTGAASKRWRAPRSRRTTGLGLRRLAPRLRRAASGGALRRPLGQDRVQRRRIGIGAQLGADRRLSEDPATSARALRCSTPASSGAKRAKAMSTG